MILLDTHVLVWAVDGVGRLGRKTKALIERSWQGGRVGVSAITFWEIALHVERNRLDLSTSAGGWRSARLDDGLIELPLDGATAVRAAGLAGLAPDPADRFIVAAALEQRATLVTADRSILDWAGALTRHDART